MFIPNTSKVKTYKVWKAQFGSVLDDTATAGKVSADDLNQKLADVEMLSFTLV